MLERTLLLIGAAGFAAAVIWVLALGAESAARYCARRRFERRRRLEARMCATSRCRSCGAIGAVEFRARAVRLLRDLEETDEGRAVRAIVDYGKRAASS